MASLSFRVPEAEPGTRIRVMVRGEWDSKPLEAVAEFEDWWYGRGIGSTGYYVAPAATHPAAALF